MTREPIPNLPGVRGESWGGREGAILEFARLLILPLRSDPLRNSIFLKADFSSAQPPLLLSLPQRHSHSDSCVGTKEMREDLKAEEKSEERTLTDEKSFLPNHKEKKRLAIKGPLHSREK